MTACWAGASSSLELQLLQPMPDYALEQLRQRFLFSLTTNHAPTVSARALLQMAFETEIGTILVKLITLPADAMGSNVCQRRLFIDIDSDMQLQGYLVSPAFASLSNIAGIPTAYVDFLKLYASSDSPRYRVCSLAALLCLAVTIPT